MTDDATGEIQRPGSAELLPHRASDDVPHGESDDQSDSGEERDLPTPLRKPTRQWWHRHLDSEERHRVMTELAIRKPDHWEFRFFMMLTLSVIVAVMGLSLNSAAVVIGAMLLAPLMQPVLAVAACIPMALFKKAWHWAIVVVVASAWSILIAYVLAAIFVQGELQSEVTSRSAPDIRDLVVAIAAGVAGAYATVRKDASASLPGVAVAVALVPPLGAVGIAMEAGSGTLARGALLLYTTNLAAIVLAGAIVFVVTGFVPPRRLANKAPRTIAVGAAVAAIVIAIAVPLYRASINAVESSENELAAQRLVSDWLGPVEASSTKITFGSDGRVNVVVRSFEDPIDQQPLIDSMRLEFGPDTRVSTEWERVQRAETTTTLAPTTTVPSDEELLYASIERIVDGWLADGSETASTRRRDALEVIGDVVRLDASGVGAAPSVTALTELLDAELEQILTVELTWLERQTVSDEGPDETPEQTVLRRLDLFARAWAEPRNVAVIEISYDGIDAVVTVAGEKAPDATDLVREVEEEILADGSLAVLFVERLDITTTTTTTTTTEVPDEP